MKRRRELPNFARLAVNFDLESLRTLVSDLIEKKSWESEAICYGETAGRIFLADFDDSKPVQASKHKLGAPEIPSESEKKLNDLLENAFRSKITQTAVSRMLPRSSIQAHVDFDTVHGLRIQIPIWTSPESLFYVKRIGESHWESRHLPADGSAWFMNQGMAHYVTNDGGQPLIHLVVTLRGQEDLVGIC